MISILRVISGTAKGLYLLTNKGMETRPTTDRVKESVFNILAPYIEDTNVLDLFAGTGSLGIEALSRGARNAVFVDLSKNCKDIIHKNLIHTKLIDRAEILCCKVLDAMVSLKNQKRQFNLIFMDPPYNKNFINETVDYIVKNDIIMSDGIIVIEKHKNESLLSNYGKLILKREEEYGDTIYSFYGF